MAITTDEVKNISRLARIELSEKENQNFQKDLEAILEYVKTIQAVDTDQVEPTSHVTGARNVMREDGTNLPPQTHTRDLVEPSEDTKNGYIKVTSIL